MLNRQHFCVAEEDTLVYYMNIDKFITLIQDYELVFKIFIKMQEQQEQTVCNNVNLTEKYLQNSNEMGATSIAELDQLLINSTSYYLNKFNLVKKMEIINQSLFDMQTEPEPARPKKHEAPIIDNQSETMVVEQIDVIDLRLNQCLVAQ